MAQLGAVPIYVFFGSLYFFGTPLGNILIWFLVTTAFLIFISYSHKRNYLRSLTKLYGESENRNFFSVHNLSITESGLSIQDEFEDSNIRWGGIERIADNGDLTFVFLGSILALVIPKSNVLEGDYTAFTEELKRRFDHFQSQAGDRE